MVKKNCFKLNTPENNPCAKFKDFPTYCSSGCHTGKNGFCISNSEDCHDYTKRKLLRNVSEDSIPLDNKILVEKKKRTPAKKNDVAAPLSFLNRAVSRPKEKKAKKEKKENVESPVRPLLTFLDELTTNVFKNSRKNEKKDERKKKSEEAVRPPLTFLDQLNRRVNKEDGNKNNKKEKNKAEKKEGKNSVVPLKREALTLLEELKAKTKKHNNDNPIHPERSALNFLNELKERRKQTPAVSLKEQIKIELKKQNKDNEKKKEKNRKIMNENNDKIRLQLEKRRKAIKEPSSVSSDEQSFEF